MSARILRLRRRVFPVKRGILASCLVMGFSWIASQACGTDAGTLQESPFLYVAWTEPVAGGWPVVCQSIYLASDGTQQNARFTDRGDLLNLEQSERSAAVFQELNVLLAPWLRSRKPTKPAEEMGSGPAPIAVDFQTPRITVAWGSPSGSRGAEEWLHSDLPPVLAPLIERAREINAQRLAVARPGSYMRLEPAMVERTPDVLLQASDLKETSIFTQIFSSPWRFVPMPAPVAVRGKSFVKELPRFVSLAERMFLLRVFMLDPTPRGDEHPNP